MADALHDLDAYIDTNRALFGDKLKQLVNIPTISADAAHAADLQRGAELAAGYLTDFGFTARIVPTEGNPVVYGECIQDPAYPTVTLYNHLDVQPAAAEEWATDPFVFTQHEDRYYGRGATDDKGPALTALFAARYAVTHGVPINIKVVWELEEEIGSTHFEAFLEAQKATLATDSVLVSDSVWLSAAQPTVDYGLRGLLAFEISLQTAAHDTHSGLTGGVARNPLGELSQIIAECYDAQTGKVSIPGFYDGVTPVAESEMESFLASGFDVATFVKAHKLEKVRTTELREVISRLMVEPTFEVHGITGGYAGPGVKTVVPAKATAKLSVRLVPHQKPQDIFKLIESFVLQKHPDVTFRFDSSAEPYLGDFTGKFADAARSAATYAFGKPPAFIREGGSIGAVVSMDRILGVPITLLGLSLPEHGYHAINEFYDWGQASRGMKLFVKYFEEVSALNGEK
jgi:acetylornithine deacetylase/succinyl-diaminopimelate desuccinylase-like protein